MNESLYIAICFFILCFLAYKFTGAKIAQIIESKMSAISNEAQRLSQAYQTSLENFSIAKINFDAAKEKSEAILASVEDECNQIQALYIAKLEIQIEKKQLELQYSVSRIYDLAEIDVRHRVIDSAQILVTEYLKQPIDLDPDTKSAAIESVVKNLRIN